jgi:hypothetical protein
MKILAKIDEAARRWDQTRDPKYKKEWYKLIHDFEADCNRTASKRNRSTAGIFLRRNNT